MHGKKDDWRTVEMMGYTYYSSKGYRILVSLVDNHIYNFVAEKSGKFLRINVVQAYLNHRDRPNSWAISRAASTLSKEDYDATISEKLDIYLAWLPHQERFIELDVDFFANSKSKHRLIPKDLM